MRPTDDEAVALLKGAVEIDSPSRHERPVAEFLVARMREFGIEAHIDDAGNAVGERVANGVERDRAKTLVLLGHIDTAPGHVPVRTDGDLFYGRGAVDAKGPCCAFIAAAARAELPADTRVVVVGAVEEEAASSKGVRFAATQYRPHACLIGEPSAWDCVTLGYKGRLLVDYRAEQPCGHTAGPEEPVAHRAIDWINAVFAYAAHCNEDRARLFDLLMTGLRDMRTGSDVLTDRVAATIGFRLPPSSSIQMGAMASRSTRASASTAPRHDFYRRRMLCDCCSRANMAPRN